MAKPNKQKRKPRPSWFKKQVDRYGTVDFLPKKSTNEIQREAMNIVRDITRDNITPNDFRYLFDNKILSNVRFTVEKEYIKLQTYYASMTFVIQSQYGVNILENSFGVAGSNLQGILNNTTNEMMAYGAALQALNNMISFNASPFPKTEEMYLEVYKTVQFQLSKFRYIL